MKKVQFDIKEVFFLEPVVAPKDKNSFLFDIKSSLSFLKSGKKYSILQNKHLYNIVEPKVI